MHGSFKRQATIEFDEFNPECEKFCFVRNLAVPPERFEFKKRKINTKIPIKETHIKAKEFIEENHSKSSIDIFGK